MALRPRGPPGVDFPYRNLGVCRSRSCRAVYAEATVGLVLSMTNYSLVAAGDARLRAAVRRARRAERRRGLRPRRPGRLAPLDPIAIADALERLLDDPALRAERARAGRGAARRAHLGPRGRAGRGAACAPAIAHTQRARPRGGVAWCRRSGAAGARDGRAGARRPAPHVAVGAGRAAARSGRPPLRRARGGAPSALDVALVLAPGQAEARRRGCRPSCCRRRRPRASTSSRAVGADAARRGGRRRRRRPGRRAGPRRPRSSRAPASRARAVLATAQPRAARRARLGDAGCRSSARRGWAARCRRGADAALRAAARPPPRGPRARPRRRAVRPARGRRAARARDDLTFAVSGVRQDLELPFPFLGVEPGGHGAGARVRVGDRRAAPPVRGWRPAGAGDAGLRPGRRRARRPGRPRRARLDRLVRLRPSAAADAVEPLLADLPLRASAPAPASPTSPPAGRRPPPRWPRRSGRFGAPGLSRRGTTTPRRRFSCSSTAPCGGAHAPCTAMLYGRDLSSCGRMSRLDRLRARWPVPAPRARLRRVVGAGRSSTLIVISGAAVRLTGSGLGCPEWPRCNGTSVDAVRRPRLHRVRQPADHDAGLDRRGRSASSSRCCAGPTAATSRSSARCWSAASLAQAVLGGITVLTGLNPVTVMSHFLLSMVTLVVAMTLVWRVMRERAGSPRRRCTTRCSCASVRALTVAGGVVVVRRHRGHRLGPLRRRRGHRRHRLAPGRSSATTRSRR